MWSPAVLLTCALAGFTAARDIRHVGTKAASRVPESPRQKFGRMPQPIHTRRDTNSLLIPQNDNTTKYAVDGTALPDVDFDIGESYAGLMPTGADSSRELYFWFFPTANSEGQDDITIWLNGGPGCSSLEGFLQENGPVLWQYGTYKPIKNYWTWVNLTNMVWVEQPVGTGFTQGEPVATSEEEIADEFLGFFKNFIDTFGLHNKKIYVTGESYAGLYVPYIADAMLNQEDTTYYNLTGTLIYDPVIGERDLQTEVVAVPFADKWSGLFNFNESFNDDLHDRFDSCGYKDYLNKYLTYPPPGPFDAPPDSSVEGCDLWGDVLNAVFLTNPCFDLYQIATTCPLLWDVLGFPGSFDYLPEGASIYFNRTEVQKAINAPIQEWAECVDGVLDTDTSRPVTLSVYPGVIERSQRTVLAHGNLDYVLIDMGARLAIQNMTWGGKQGFQDEPSDDFYVPYHPDASLGTLAAAGNLGITHTERGFTWVETFLSGHMVPQYAPSAAYRQLEYLLGRIDSLTEVSDFST
ncbi:putative serine carboxypeptidase [Pseudovirgaria hyperparasitica]|uniref:Carboxypeptidase n=1 Tax=Pseudovirgaria hyperparasitica TaxID=470096 RepID=A0A6A6W9U1_9PEZI|nr:putative serine carboxypeptidase [Pseudovirgaria hyperparasitica]KAF2758357.1 putative serine carboxypeptidase [Pseudovirgaria hyperparasitica]